MNRQTQQAQVAVVGAGPAGLSAALAAAQAGAQVTLIDNYRQPGGQYYRQPAPELTAATPLEHQAEGRTLWQQAQAAGVTILTQATVWGAFEEGHRLELVGPEAPPAIQAEAVILATGAYERAAALPGWTLPGVMTTGAVQTLLKEQRILPGQRFVLAGTGPLQLVVAAELVRAGAEVVAVLEGNPLWRRGASQPFRHGAALWGQWSRLAEGLNSWQTLRRAGVPFHTGWGVVAAEGRDEVNGVTIARLDEQWRPVAGTFRPLACDTLCCSYGFVPANELARLIGVGHHWQQGQFIPHRDERLQSDRPGIYLAGDCAGIGGAGLALVEGRLAGLAAAAQVQGQEPGPAIEQLQPTLRRERRFQRLYSHLFTPGPGLDELARPDTILCRCEEVTLADLHQAIDRGADTLAACKGLTRCGMGNCQGRVCEPLVTAALARKLNRSQAEVGQLGIRPPLFPVPMLALNPSLETADQLIAGEGVTR